MKFLVLIFSVLMLSGCSTPNFDVHSYLDKLTQKQINLNKKTIFEIEATTFKTTSQRNRHIFKLQHSTKEVKAITQNIARKYGFGVTNGDNANFALKLIAVMPDNTLCNKDAVRTVKQNLRYSASILTLGVAPATSVYCLIVRTELYKIVYGERELIAKFGSNAGQVKVYAGANDIESYQLVVTQHDEEKALEVSIASLFNQLMESQILK